MKPFVTGATATEQSVADAVDEAFAKVIGTEFGAVLEPAHRKHDARGRPAKVPDQQIIDAAKNGLTRSQAAELFGISCTAISYRAERLGLKFRYGKGWSARRGK